MKCSLEDRLNIARKELRERCPKLENSQYEICEIIANYIVEKGPADIVELYALVSQSKKIELQQLDRLLSIDASAMFTYTTWGNVLEQKLIDRRPFGTNKNLRIWQFVPDLQYLQGNTLANYLNKKVYPKEKQYNGYYI